MKRFAVIILVLVVASLATVANAERDRIPGIGTTGTQAGTMEHGDIGGIKPR